VICVIEEPSQELTVCCFPSVVFTYAEVFVADGGRGAGCTAVARAFTFSAKEQ